MESITGFIESKLKLLVNKDKSQVCEVNQTKFLGYTIQKDGNLTIAEKSIERFKEKVRSITTVSYTHLDVYKRQGYEDTKFLTFKYANGVVMTEEPFDEKQTKGVKFWGDKGLSLIHI